MSLTVSGLSKKYGDQLAINDISFSINKGGIVGFLGPNGAGKSTTMKIITGYLQADSGNVEVAGINLNTHPLEAKRKIGYLPEANPLYYDMFVREYLSFICSIYSIADPKKKIEEMIELVGLKPEAGKKTGQLSKGYKQRVGLAAALIHDPEILILDEPTSGLDPNQILEIRSVIKSLSENKTVLFSSHIMQEVEAICDHVIIINKGNIVANDSMKKIRNNKSDIVRVKFSKKVDSSLFSALTADELIPMEPLPSAEWRIRTINAEIARKEILQISIEKELDIISLTSETDSLESIFRSLTS